MIYLELLAIAFIVVYIIDETGIIESIKSLLKKWLKTSADISIKPIDCSLCMTHWIGLIYAYLYNELNVYVYLYILFLCCNTNNIYAIITKANEIIFKIINGTNN